MSLERALLILLVLGAASRGCWSCSIQGFEVTTAQPAANAALRLSNLYSLGDIDSHFKHMTNPKLVSNKGQSYTCVDARGDDDHLSSPGWVGRESGQLGQGTAARICVPHNSETPTGGISRQQCIHVTAGEFTAVGQVRVHSSLPGPPQSLSCRSSFVCCSRCCCLSSSRGDFSELVMATYTFFDQT